MKQIWIYLFLILFFQECSESRDDNSSNKIDALLEQANNYNINEKERIKIIKKVDFLLSKSLNDSVTRSRYLRLAGRYFNANDYENYLKISRKLYKMAVNGNDPFYKAKSLNYIADYYYSRFNNDSAYYYFTKAEKAYKLISEKEDLVRIKFSKAIILIYEKNFSAAEVQIIQVLKEAKELNNQRLIYDCYISLGNALDGMNYTKESVDYYTLAIQYVENLKNDPQYYLIKAQSYNYLGKVYSKNGQYLKAIDNFNRALKIANFKITEPFMYANLINNKAYAEMQLGKFESAKNKIDEALQVRQKIENIPGIVSSKLMLSEFFLLKKDTANAVLGLRYARKIASSNKIYEDELKAVRLLSKIDLKNKAIYFDRYIKLTDSLQNVERANRNKFARIEFETDEILDQKKSILEQNKKISSQKWIILTISLVSIFILGLAYYLKNQRARYKQLQFEKAQQENNEEIYRLMLRQQTLIEEVRKNEKKRISQELHDGVMSKLTSTRLNLFILGKKKDEETINKCLHYIDDIQNIEKEIRNISHNLNKHSIFEKDSFKVIIENLFQEYCNATEINYTLNIDSNIVWSKVDSSTKMHLYRIFQECLQNIFKYSKAKNVFLNILKINNESFFIKIEDDGIGFDSAKATKGIGLKNMKTRVKEFKGIFKLDSQIGRGTVVEIVIPFL